MESKTYNLTYIEAVLYQARLQRIAKNFDWRIIITILPVLGSPTLSKLLVISEKNSFIKLVDNIFST